MTSPNNTVGEIVPMAFINGAIDYQAAADDLYGLRYERRKEHEGLDPIYFLYFHALELAFKGYLRAHGKTTKELAERTMGHQLTSLCVACTELVGVLDEETRRSLENVVSLLEASNRSMGLRYFTMQSRSFPELDWTRDVVHALVQSAKCEVLKLDSAADAPGPAVKFDFTVRQPEPKNRMYEPVR